MTDMLKAFTLKLERDQRCNGCGIMIGPHTDRKAGLLVKEGDHPGLFHNSQCYEQSRGEVNKDNESI